MFQHQLIYKYDTLLYDPKANKTKLAFESYQEPEMSWRFSVWEGVANTGDEPSQEPEMSWRFLAREDMDIDDEFYYEPGRFSDLEDKSFDPEMSSNESSSEDDEWMFDSGDDLSTPFP